jgi:hypothetical protein
LSFAALTVSEDRDSDPETTHLWTQDFRADVSQLTRIGGHCFTRRDHVAGTSPTRAGTRSMIAVCGGATA